MYSSFDPFEYLQYLRRRWLVVAAACGAAILLSLGVSLTMTRRYTATASIVIEPPGGNDVRTSTAVSPVYLESLKTYERFATSDSLFERAAEQFHLRDGGRSIESLKRQVLSVSKIRDTKILEISASLPDPKLAQKFAQFVADETVNISRGENLASDREFIEEARKQAAEAQERLNRVEKGWTELAATAPLQGLQSDLDGATAVLTKVREELVKAEGDVAEYQQQSHSDGQFAKEQLQAAQARVALLEKRSQELQRTIQEKSALIANRAAKREQLQAELKMAQTAWESASTRLREISATAGMRGERLRVIDPGIVPQRPSSPNIPLSVAIALFIAGVSSILYLSFGFVYRRRAADFEPAASSRGMRV